MKIIIYGITDISYLIVKDLCKNHDITLIDDKEELPSKFEKLDISFISGNISDKSVLKSANVSECDLFIACSGYDESNIVASWSVMRVSNIETVCFVSKLEYFNNISTDDFFISEVGIDHVMWPEESLVKEIFRIVSVPEVVYVDYFEKGKARLFEYKIKEDFPLLNKELKYCSFPPETIMVALTRNEELFIPNGSTKILAGDKPIFIGSPKGMSILARNFFSTKEERIDSAVIIGGGNIGFMLAKRLESVNISTKIIEKDKSRCEFLADKLSKTLVINSSGVDTDLFYEEEIGEADAVINVTSNDETNLFCSVLARQLGAKKIFSKTSSDSLVPIFEKAGVDVILSPGRTILNELKSRIINKDENILSLVGKGQGSLFEIDVPSAFDGYQVKDLHLPYNAVIAVVKKVRKVTIPKGNTLLNKNDKMIIFTKSDNAVGVKEFFRKKEDNLNET